MALLDSPEVRSKTNKRGVVQPLNLGEAILVSTSRATTRVSTVD